MERREALAKLGAGGAAIAGVSLIRSSPAFAYGQPTLVISPSITVRTNGSGSVAEITVAHGTATCPLSATNPPSAAVTGRSFRVSRADAGGNTFRIYQGSDLPQTVTGLLRPAFPNTSYIEVQKVNVFDNPTNFSANNSIRVEMSVTFTCTYSDGTQRSRVATRTQTATWVPGTSPWIIGG